MRSSIIALAALCIARALGNAQAADLDIGRRTPEQVVAHHVASAAAGNLDAMMSDFADDAVLIGNYGVTSGKAAIRAQFAKAARRGPSSSSPVTPTVTSPDSFSAAEFARMRLIRFADGRTIQFLQRHYTSNTAFIMSVDNPGKPDELHSVQTFVIRDGKIVLEAGGTFIGHLVAP